MSRQELTPREANSPAPLPGVPRTAMVMAAGLGTRMGALSETTPKPLLRVGGRPLIDGVLDRLVDAGVQRAVVNLHHLGDVIAAHLAARTTPKIEFSREDPIQDTGGGIRQALPLLGPDPFIVANAKIIWLDGKENALGRMGRAWDDARMDALLLLYPSVDAVSYDGPGDFFVDQIGRVRRRRSWEVAPFVYTGVQIVHPRLFADAPEGPFSMNLLWDRAIENERLYALRHDGEWYQVSTPQHLAVVEERIRGGAHHYFYRA